MCQASAVNACISRRNVYGKRAILYIRKNSIRAVAAAFRRISFLILFAFLSDTRSQENILWNITRARVTGAVWSARHANATRSSYVSAGFQKRRSGMSEMRHLDVGELAGREPKFMTTNSLVTRSLGDGTRSGFVGERERLFLKLCTPPLAFPCVLYK